VAPIRAGQKDRVTVTVSVLVVDDQASVVELLRLLLEQDDRFGHVWSAHEVERAMACATEHQPDVVVLDASLGSEDGLALVPALRRAAPGVAILVFSSAPYADLSSARLAGADAFVEKGTDLDVVLDTVFEARRVVDLTCVEALS
jgi:DNA-binding NarL/FixJ family response regulator